jgi:hypothetical protein
MGHRAHGTVAVFIASKYVGDFFAISSSEVRDTMA